MTTPRFGPLASARALIDRRARCRSGSNNPTRRGTSHTITVPTTRVRRTATIIRTAIADPSGQFCAPLNCEAIIAPIMLPLAPPRTVAVT